MADLPAMPPSSYARAGLLALALEQLNEMLGTCICAADLYFSQDGARRKCGNHSVPVLLAEHLVLTDDLARRRFVAALPDDAAALITSGLGKVAAQT